MKRASRRAVPDSWVTDVATALAAAVARAPMWTLAAVVLGLPLVAIGVSVYAACVTAAAGGVVAAALAGRPRSQVVWPALVGLVVCIVGLLAMALVEFAGANEFPLWSVILAGTLLGSTFAVSGLARAAARRPWLARAAGVVAVSFLAAFGTVEWISESRVWDHEGPPHWIYLGVRTLGVIGIAATVVVDGARVRWIAYPLAGYALHLLGSYDATAIAGAVAIMVIGGRTARVARLARPDFDDAITSLANRLSLRPWRTVLSIALVSVCVWFTMVAMRTQAVSEVWSNDGRPDSPYPSVWAAFGALPTSFLAAAVVTQAALQRSSELVERLVPWIAFGVGAAAFVYFVPDVQEFLDIGSGVAIVFERWMVPMAFAALVPGALVATRPPHGRIGWLEITLLVVTIVTAVTAGLVAHVFRDVELFGLVYYVTFLAMAGWFVLVMRAAATLTSVRRMWLGALVATVAISAGSLTFLDDVLAVAVTAGFTALHLATAVAATVLVRRMRCLTPLPPEHPARIRRE